MRDSIPRVNNRGHDSLVVNFASLSKVDGEEKVEEWNNSIPLISAVNGGLIVSNFSASLFLIPHFGWGFSPTNTHPASIYSLYSWSCF